MMLPEFRSKGLALGVPVDKAWSLVPMNSNEGKERSFNQQDHVGKNR
jgi:hypothetical protein